MSRQPQRPETRWVLATDLDGTFIPLDEDARNQTDLETLERELRNNAALVFVTGRHFESVMQAVADFQLPAPDAVICDVGTSIFERSAEGEYQAVDAYRRRQDEIIAPLPIAELRSRLEAVDGLRLQEPEKQGRFKLSYYCDAARLGQITDAIQQVLSADDAPYSIIRSVDPFNSDGLIDLLPRGVSKACALTWWIDYTSRNADDVVFAGDSGNDLAALTAGHRAIVVGNADRKLAREVYDAHRREGWENRLYLASGQATSGVLEGCRWFGLIGRTEDEAVHRELPGATPITCDETHFRVWAPDRKAVEVQIEGVEPSVRHELARDARGYFSGNVPGAGPGTLYRYVLDGEKALPDPVSRFQPEGVHGPSEVVAFEQFPWTDQQWQGVHKQDLVIYELHIGSLTREGTFRAAIDVLPELVELGVTAVELMPVAQSPGRWNWGYDGVNLFAVRNTYGEPDDLKALVDACHAAGLAVILDVVYNHLGPEGNYWGEFGPYYSTKHHTPWGEAFNFDETRNKEVRRFVIGNALFWIEEYHFDGLRLDAAHFILDDSEVSVLDEMRRAVSALADQAGRTIHLIAESNVCDHEMLREVGDRKPFDGIWCDCLMHSIYSHAVPELQLTHREYRGAGDLAEVLQYGYLYAGADYVRVSSEDREEPPHSTIQPGHIASFITSLQTHDSIGNHPLGLRIHHLTSESFQRSAIALVLLYPSIPLIFMGEQYATDARFPFFVDFEDLALQKGVDEGRSQEYMQHDWSEAVKPSSREAFELAKCCEPHTRNPAMIAWYRQLLALRRQGVAEGWLSTGRMTTGHNPDRHIFSLRYELDDGGAINIVARLTTVGGEADQAAEVPLEGELLMSSEPDTRRDEGRLRLGANHAVILRSTGMHV